jgi:hypothetical protein
MLFVGGLAESGGDAIWDAADLIVDKDVTFGSVAADRGGTAR